MKPKHKFVILMLILGISSGSVFAQNADEIFKNFFNTTGGLNVRKNLKTVKITGTAPSPRGEFPITMYNKAPNLMKVVLEIQGQQYIAQAYDGSVAWGLNPFQGGKNAQKFPDEQAANIASDADFDETYVYTRFINYGKQGYKATVDGKEQVDGRECYKIKMEKVKGTANDPVEYFYFDTETKYLNKYTMTGISEDKKWEKHQVFSDYREIKGGLKMPFFQEVKFNDKVLRKLLVTEIVANDDIDNKVFAFPN